MNARFLALLFVAADLTAASAQTYTFTTFAGTAGGAGIEDGAGASARFNAPQGVAVDTSGNIFVADSDNKTIRKITPAGIVTTFAGLAGVSGTTNGTGSAARFSNPTSVAADGAGNLYVTDVGPNLIRKITPTGVVTTLAGNGSYFYNDGIGTAAGFDTPGGLAVDGAGNVYVADRFANTIRKITPAAVVTTFAGQFYASGSADGTGSSARFNTPNGIAVDRSGNVYVTDTENSTIRKITPGAVVTTLAGLAGQAGTTDGTGANARFNFPVGLAIDGADNLYVSDLYSCTIRKITPAGMVTTLAGQPGIFDSTDGTGSAARFRFPVGLTADGAGNVIVADTYNHVIRRITPAGVVTTLAGTAPGSVDGTGPAARFNGPGAVATDSNGNLFVAETYNSTIRKITPAGKVTTVAGTAGTIGSTDGTGAAARFTHPAGVAVDAAGTVFVADTDNHTIRKITPTGVVSTLAGLTGSSGSVNGTGTAARFNGPHGIAVDRGGNVFVADYENHVIRKITAAGVVTTLAGLAGNYGSADGTGSAARFFFPAGVAVDSGGNVFVGERFNRAIRKITPAGVVTTVTKLVGGLGVAVDGNGNIFVADTFYNAIRQVLPDGSVVTLAGTTIDQPGSADGAGSAAQFRTPSAVAVDASGNLYIADTDNHTIRKGALPVVAPPVSRLINLSTRGLVPAGGELTIGFVIRGSGAKSLLARAVGPTLASFGVDGTLADPKIDLIPAGASTAADSNDDWGGGATLAAAFSGVGAFALPAASKDAAVLATAPAASYSVRITSSLTGGTGIAIAEVYDRDAADVSTRLVNLSTLGFVGTGANALTTGFVIRGTEPKNLLIRAVGPGLIQFGVGATLTDPQLTIIPLGQTVAVGGSDDWGGTAALSAAFTAAGAFGLPASSKDAAVVVRLPPGGYTVTVSGVAETTGRALVEIYDLDP